MTTYSGIQELEILEEAVHYNRFLVGLICDAAGSRRRVVDFGAGMGTLAVGVAARGFEVCCVEPDATLAQVLASRGMRSLQSLDAVASHSTEFIYSVNVFEHIEDDEDTLRQLHDKLQPGGRILVYVPAFPILYSGMDRSVGHVRRYTKSDLKKLVQRCGFQIESVRYADSAGFFASLVYKWIGSHGLSRSSVRLYDRFVFPWSRVLDSLGLSRILGKNLLVIASRTK